jgi:peptide-methionine (S)-S-oxide reductase
MGCQRSCQGLHRFVPAALVLSLSMALQTACAEPAVSIPPPALDSPKAQAGLETAVLAGGCFWGMQGVFEHVKGVRQVISGFAGGKKDTAHYETVSTGTTGHAESVQITFDPHEVSYGELLRVYFSVAHDPTELDRQGPDEGPQYRSDIFYANDTQRKIATAYIAQLEGAHVFHGKIVTRVDPLTGFYPAEQYHQDYLIHNPDNPYIVINDLPKIQNLRHMLPQMYAPRPVLVAAAGK